MADTTYRLSISYTLAGQFAMNVLHYRFDDSLYSNRVSAAAALNNAFNTHCTGAIKDAIPSATRILSYKSRAIQGGGGFEAVLLAGAGDVGNRGGNLSTSGLAPMIRFITNSFPPIQGRIFLPGVSDLDCHDGYLEPTLFTDLTDLANALDDPLTLAGGGAPVATPVVYSQSPVKASFAIVAAVPSPYLSSQRKRQRPA